MLDVRLPFEDAIRREAEQWLLLVLKAIIFNRSTLERTEFFAYGFLCRVGVPEGHCINEMRNCSLYCLSMMLDASAKFLSGIFLGINFS